MKKQKRGFTLIELMVAITIIGILASAITIAVSSSRKQARDTKRYADLAQVQVALELYKSAKGSYPSTGKAFWTVCTDGADATARDTTGTSGYIPGLAPTYLVKLPTDPTGCVGGAYHGYVYISDGVDYKFATDYTAEVGTKCFTGETYSDPGRSVVKGSAGPFFCSVYSAGAAAW